MEHQLALRLVDELDHGTGRAEPDFHPVKIFFFEFNRGQKTVCNRHIAKIKKFREFSITDSALLCHIDLSPETRMPAYFAIFMECSMCIGGIPQLKFPLALYFIF